MNTKAQTEQLDLFMIPLPPCGRGVGLCRAILTYEPSAIMRCITWGCIAPVLKSARRAHGLRAISAEETDEIPAQQDRAGRSRQFPGPKDPTRHDR